MPRHLHYTCSLIASTVALAGCADTGRERAATRAPRTLAATQAQPPAPAAAQALTQIADGAAARRRLGYVNLERLGEVRSVVAARSLSRSVLGAAASADLPASGVHTVVAVGGAIVARGPRVAQLAGTGGAGASGRDGIVVGGGAALRDVLANPRPQVSAITPAAPSAVQSCLGDTAAETILGSAAMGRDAVVGAGLRAAHDPPAGVQLVICVAPHLRRELFAARRRVRRLAASLDVAPERLPVIEISELGERDILSAILPADAVGARRLLALLRGGAALRALGGRR